MIQRVMAWVRGHPERAGVIAVVLIGAGSYAYSHHRINVLEAERELLRKTTEIHAIEAARAATRADLDGIRAREAELERTIAELRRRTDAVAKTVAALDRTLAEKEAAGAALVSGGTADEIAEKLRALGFHPIIKKPAP